MVCRYRDFLGIANRQGGFRAILCKCWDGYLVGMAYASGIEVLLGEGN